MACSLDAASQVLLAAGLDDEAAFARDRARAMVIPVPLLTPRGPLHESLAEQLEARLGAERAAERLAEGERASPEEVLARVLGWLNG